MTTKTKTSTSTRCLRPWSLARAAAREEWVWSHPQDVRGIPERILREDLGDEAAERLMRDASAAAAARAARDAAGAAQLADVRRVLTGGEP